MPEVDDEKRPRSDWPLILGIGCGGLLVSLAIILALLWRPLSEILKGLSK